MKPKNYLKAVIDQVETNRCISGVNPDDTLDSLGFDSLEVAELEMDLENTINLYTASTRSWLFKTDSIRDAAAKLEKWHKTELAKLTENEHQN